MLKLDVDQMMEVSWRYTQCDLNLKEATWLIHVKTGLDQDLAEDFLKGLNRDNVTTIDFAKHNRRRGHRNG